MHDGQDERSAQAWVERKELLYLGVLEVPAERASELPSEGATEGERSDPWRRADPGRVALLNDVSAFKIVADILGRLEE